MYYNLLNATCNLDLPESDGIINKLIVVGDKEEEEEQNWTEKNKIQYIFK